MYYYSVHILLILSVEDDYRLHAMLIADTVVVSTTLTPSRYLDRFAFRILQEKQVQIFCILQAKSLLKTKKISKFITCYPDIILLINRFIRVNFLIIKTNNHQYKSSLLFNIRQLLATKSTQKIWLKIFHLKISTFSK